ncbi:MAG: hypothetical protein KF901_33215 [Myxococcales bacterium]|nr:hypothetical protein [Myxococcales bacterium]
MNTLVRLSAEPTRTRVLITQGPNDIGKAVLPRSANAHPRSMVTWLEGLSLLLGEQLRVVLCVDDRSGSSDSLGLADALDVGRASVFYEVDVAPRSARGDRRRAKQRLRLSGNGDFRDLRPLTWEWTR